jgi:hypothetical protein
MTLQKGKSNDVSMNNKFGQECADCSSTSIIIIKSTSITEIKDSNLTFISKK